MANKLQIKRSAVPGKVPTTADLDLGELAINTYDGKAYMKKNVSGVETVVLLTGAGAGDVLGPASSGDNAIARFDLTSGKIIQNSSATVDDSGNINALTMQASGTDANKMPVGTTAQRPATPSAGMYRMNSTTGEPEWYDASASIWQKFRELSYLVEYIIVAGGGSSGGNAQAGGGGGGGGTIVGSMYVSAKDTYSAAIGAGAAANSQSVGGSSSFGSITATGGGSGGYGANSVLNNGISGGSGGGGASSNLTGTTSGGSGTTGQGSAGGTGVGNSNAALRASGGGGGKAAVGQNANSSGSGYGGNGGAGYQWLDGNYYGGGGGGGGKTAGGSGGIGGGGAGCGGNSCTGAQNGAANTGGGGGSGYNDAADATSQMRNGGSGVVILRYAGAQRGQGGSVTSVGGYTYHTFTSSGNYTA